MKCANPGCDRWADDLQEGILRLIERMVPPEERVTGADGGFPVCSVQARYFWLCRDCSISYIIRGWHGQELILEPRVVSIDAGAFTAVKKMPPHQAVSRAQLEIVRSKLA